MATHYADIEQLEEVTQTGTWQFRRADYTIHFSPFLSRLFGRESMHWGSFMDMVPMQYRSMMHLFKEDVTLPFNFPDGQTLWLKRHYIDYGAESMQGSLSVVPAPQFTAKDESLELMVDYFETLYRALPVGVSICNRQGAIIDANEANLQLFKVKDKNQLLGYNVLTDSKLPDNYKQQLEQDHAFINYTYSFNYEELKGYYESYGEGEMTLMCRIQRMYNRKGEFIGFLVINLDLSELQRKSRELEIMFEKATESDRLKTAFLSNIQHEIRTPLNAITGFADMLTVLADRLPQSDELQDCVKQISANKKLLLEVFGKVLQLSELESGITGYKREPVNMCELLGLACDRWQDNMAPDVALRLNLPAEPLIVEADHLMLYHVLTNLLSNAQKFTTEGSITITLSPTPTGGAHIEVADTGTGIKPEQLPTVFDRFVKTDAFVPGSGVGLSICRHIITMAGGQIGVKPNHPHGCIFWFEV